MEIVFVDKRRKGNVQPPPPLSGIERVTSVKILGVTITNTTRTHNNQFVRTDTLYALRVLRSHEMDDSALQTVFHYVVIAKLQYASSVWWDSLRQQNDIVLMHLFVVVHVVVSFHLTRRRLKLSAAQPTKSCLRT